MESANYGQHASGSMRREILTLTIEIGEGQNDDIQIFEGDDPNYLAAEFAAKHGIGEQLQELLAEQIRQNIEQLELEQQNQMAHNLSEQQVDPQMIGSHEVEMFVQPDQMQATITSDDPNILGYDTFHPSKGQSTQAWNSRETNQVLTVPSTDGYKHWQQELNSKLKGSGKKDKPTISAGSRAIMQNKRQIAEAQGNSFYRAPVHERLHRQAMQKHANSAKALRRENQSFSYRAPGHSNTIDHDSTSKPRANSAARRPPVPQQSGPNYGERLYNRGIKKREELQMRIRNARSE